MEVLHDVRAKRRVGVARAVGHVAVVALLAGCRDAPDRAALPVDTAALQDRRIFEGDVGRDTGRDTGRPAGDTLGTDTLSGAGIGGADSEPTLVLAADSAAGYLLYHRSAGCIACHGADGRGLENLGPSLRDSIWLHIDGSVPAIEEVIRSGIARPREALIAMPGLGARLDSGETYRIAAYVHSLSHPGAVAPDTVAARDSLRARRADSLDTAPPPPISMARASGNVRAPTVLSPDQDAQARRHQR